MSEYGCARHGTDLKKTRMVTGKVMYVCPRKKCKYRVDKNGERVRRTPTSV